MQKYIKHLTRFGQQWPSSEVLQQYGEIHVISEPTLNRNISENLILVLFLGCGVRPSPLGTPATNAPIIPAPDDRLVWWVQRRKPAPAPSGPQTPP
jgi:hypothetical protein